MNLNKLLLVETLIQVIDSGSFSAAANKLGVSQSTVSRRIASLEQELGGDPLFRRSTRWIEPTNKTSFYVEHARSLLKQFDELALKANENDAGLSGNLMVSLPPSLGRQKLLAPLAELINQYSSLNCQFDLSERYIDFNQTDIDIAVRIQPAKQSGISQILLAKSKLVMCAAPKYLRSHPPIASFGDLKKHRLIGLTSLIEHQRLRESGSFLSEAFPIEPRIVINDVSGALSLIQDGFGVGLLPDFLAVESLNAGKLVELLPNRKHPTYNTYALFPWGLRDTKKIQVGLAALKSAFS